MGLLNKGFGQELCEKKWEKNKNKNNCNDSNTNKIAKNKRKWDQDNRNIKDKCKKHMYRNHT